MTTSRGTQVLPVLTAAALAVALTGCAPAAAPAETAAAAETTASATPTPENTTQDAPATALTREYLDAIAQGDYETSWSLLSDESQAFYGTVDTYSSNYELDGTVTAAEAAELGEGELTESEGPEGAFTLVNGSTDTIADAWIVRETDAGLRIDDSGVPPTGESTYWWTNPSAGAEDQTDPGVYEPSTPLSIRFAAVDPADGPSRVGSPTTIWAWQDGEPIEAELDAASGAERAFILAKKPESTPHAVTVVWQVGDDSLEWRSSTVVI